MDQDILLECRKMNKTFGPTRAVSDADFSLRAGEIRGLIGENGSGKSTLCGMITGMLHPDSGEMFFCGQPYHPTSPIDARQKGISILLQETGTINGLTVAANIFLGKEKQFQKFGLVNQKKMEQETKRILDEFNWDIQPDRMIDTLSFEERKLVEVLRASHDEPKILIVDETTTALTQTGREQIYKIIQKMKDAGRSVIFITHDLNELMDVCDTITALRDGCVIDTFDKVGHTEHDIRQKMIGRDMSGSYYRESGQHTTDSPVVLAAHDVSYGSKVRHVSMELHQGEIVGIGGLSECGMHELGKLLFGAVRSDTGSVTVYPSKDQISDVHQAIQNEIAYIPKDRDMESIFLTASIRDNISIASLDNLTSHGLISGPKERALAKNEAEKLSVKMQGIEQLAKALSGGNKQKIAIAKWMANNSRIIIMDCPTRGIDIGVKAAIYALMERLTDTGYSIIMISEELPELLGMADRLFIMKNGRVSGVFSRAQQVSESDIIKIMI